MQEDFLWYIWQHRRFSTPELFTECGKALHVDHPGSINRDAGPDFSFARIRLNGQAWVGQVEMHVRSSEWIKHTHHLDPAYCNVILHVVWENDRDIYLERPGDLPVLVLSKVVDPGLVSGFEDLVQRSGHIMCGYGLADLDPLVQRQWLDRMAIERLELLADRAAGIFERTGGDWQETLYILIARSFGMRVNTEPFERLARSIPYRIVARYRSKETLTESLLFGQSGLLDESYTEDHPSRLLNEYRLWRPALGLESLSPGSFRFMRMQPAGFPTLRIAQFAAFLKAVHPLYELIRPDLSVKDLTEMLRQEPNDYWRFHYKFGSLTNRHQARAGENLAHRVIQNAVVPVLFLRYRLRNDLEARDQSIRLLEELPPEDNRVVRLWSSNGMNAANAADTQGLAHAFKHWCTPKKCVSCLIGRTLLSG